MKLPVSWLREFVNPAADPAEIAAAMAARGFAVEGLEHDVIDFEVTANRPDCLSVYGLAREVAAAFDLPLAAYRTHPRTPETPESALAPAASIEAAGPGPDGPPAPSISIDSPLCARYVLASADVRVGPSPAWLADRLTACGVRPINTIVDATNYVMLEMGQPLHAFDASRLSGGEIRVRLAKAGERLTTLDGETRALDGSMLVIADAERAAAVAGVMGGRATEVSGATRRVAIESAWFQPASVRATSRRLGLKTEASTRFERGADIEAARNAIERTLALLEELGAGRRVGPVADVYRQPAAARTVEVSRAHVARLIGAAIPDADIARMLSRLGFTLESVPDGWRASVPSFRVDVAREADVIEEIARQWGFDRVTPTSPAAAAPPAAPSERVRAGRDVRRVLAAAGLDEAVTFTFLERSAADPFADDAAGLVDLANPLSEKFAVLRPSLVPGLLDACVYNQRRQEPDVRLFEAGSVFAASGERAQVAWVLSGTRHEHWSEPARPTDFFDASGIAELLARAFDLQLRAEPADDLGWGLPGRAARLFDRDGPGHAPVGAAAQIAPGVVAARGGGADAVVAGFLWLEPLLAARGRRDRTVTALPRVPSIVRDLSIVVDERLPAETVRGTIRANAPATLEDVCEFDRYRGQGIPEGHVSLSVRLTFRDADRTLTDDEAGRAVDAIVEALGRTHGARLR